MAFILPIVRFAGARLVSRTFVSQTITGPVRSAGLRLSTQRFSLSVGTLIENGFNFGRAHISIHRALSNGRVVAKEYFIKKRYAEAVRNALGGDGKKGGKFAGAGLKGLNGILQQSLKNTSNSYSMTANVDTSNYDKSLKEYMNYTRKDLTEVVNQKAYWIAINAIKETYRANKTDIKNEMEKPSDKMQGLTVAEALVVYKNSKGIKKKMTRGEVRKEARTLTNKRTRSIGFLRSGWIPAIQALAPYVQRTLSVGSQATKRGKDKGGAKPASRTAFTNNIVATIWNSVEADNNAKARNYMQTGLQKALDAEAKSMMAYVEKKMQQNADKFNKA